MSRWLALSIIVTLMYLMTGYPQPRPVTVIDLGGSLDRLSSPHLRHLASPLHPIEHRGLEVTHQQSYYVLGEDRKVYPAFPHDYFWVDSDTRTEFKGYHKQYVNTNIAMAKLPPGSGYDAVALARGLSNEYRGSDEPGQSLRNTTIVGYVPVRIRRDIESDIEHIVDSLSTTMRKTRSGDVLTVRRRHTSWNFLCYDNILGRVWIESRLDRKTRGCFGPTAVNSSSRSARPRRSRVSVDQWPLSI